MNILLTMFLLLVSAGYGVCFAQSPVQSLLHSGKISFYEISRAVEAGSTAVEVVLVDSAGISLGGYAPPFLESQQRARELWKDFPAINLGLIVSPERVTYTEVREAQNEAFALAFVLDHSASMTNPHAYRMQHAVRRVLQSFMPEDYVTVIKFTGSVNTEVPVSNSQQYYLSKFKVNGLDLRTDGTAIYDAAIRGIEELVEAQGVKRRIMILFTDGEDNESSATLAEVVDAGKKANVIVYGVTFGRAKLAPIEHIARSTGGSVFKIKDMRDFDRVFVGIYNSLRHHYVVTVNEAAPVEVDPGDNMTMTATSSTTQPTLFPTTLLPLSAMSVVPTTVPNSITAIVNLTYLNGTEALSVTDCRVIDTVVTVLIQHPTLQLEIRFNTEPNSDSPRSEALAKRRGKSICNAFVKRGIPIERLHSYTGSGTSKVPISKDLRNKTTFVFTRE